MAPWLLLVLTSLHASHPAPPPEVRAAITKKTPASFVEARCLSASCASDEGAFVPCLHLAPEIPAATGAALCTAQARALFDLPFSPAGVDAITLARLTGVSARQAASLVESCRDHGVPPSAHALTRMRFIGEKTAAKLEAKLLFGAEALAPCWPSARVFGRGERVWRPYLVELLRFLPQSAISRLWGWLARVQRPSFAVQWLKAAFVRANGLNMDESMAPIESFACLEDLFVRALKPGLRPIEEDVRTIVSPVDGHVGATGVVTDGLLLQVKGHSYTLAELLDEPSHARFFEGGAYMTIYLAPKDYHRIHAPQAGHVTSARLIPGLLMPVFPEALVRVEHLFARNERIVTYMKSPDAGGIALVAVGATLVGRIRVHYDAHLRGNEGERTPRGERYAKPTWLERGEELGAFELGSTIVLICQPGMVSLDALAEGQRILMGQRIGVSQKAPRGRDTGGAPEFLQPLFDEDEL